jgi:hypothetical protein
MAEKESDQIREQNLRKLQDHLDKLQKHDGKPPKETEGDLRSEVERARAEFMRDFMDDFATWERLYGKGELGPEALAARDRANDLKLLGVSSDAGKEDIRRAFYALAKQNHPDTGGDEAMFRELMAAYRNLTDG